MNLLLIAHKTYAFGGAVYRSNAVVTVDDEKAEELLSHRTDEGQPVFQEYTGEVTEDSVPVQAAKKPLRSGVVITKGAKKTEPVADPEKTAGNGGGKGGTDLARVTV